MEQLVGFVIFVGIAVVIGIFFAEFFLEVIGFFFLSWGTAKKNSKEDNIETSKLTQSTGVVIKAIIPPGHGQIKYGGSFWRAVAEEPIPVDTIVQIVEQKDLVLEVHPLPTFKAEQGGKP
jgi:membrane protein implicated in regulation of membrane protease activity